MQGGFEFGYPISFFGFDITPVFGFEFRSRFSVFDLTPVFDFEFAFRSRFSVSIFDPVFDFDFVSSISILGSEFRFGSSVSMSFVQFRLSTSALSSAPIFGSEIGSGYSMSITFGCLDFCGAPCGGQFLLKSAWWTKLDSPFLRCLPLVQSPIGRSPVSSVLAVTFEFELSLGFRVSGFGFRV